MNGAERIVKAMKTVNKSNQTIPSEIVSVTLTKKNPLTFMLENRLELTPGFYELGEFIDWEKTNVGDVFKAFSFNENQRYYILQSLDTSGGTNSPSVISQLQAGVAAMQPGINIPIGGGCDYFGATEPENFMFADGRALSISEYPQLYAVIGESYRNENNTDITTFNLPDKSKRHSIPKGEDDNLGDKGGNEKLFALANPTGAGVNYKNATEDFITDYWVDGQGGSKGYGGRTNGNAGIKIGGVDDINSSRELYIICNYIIRVK